MFVLNDAMQKTRGFDDKDFRVRKFAVFNIKIYENLIWKKILTDQFKMLDIWKDQVL